MSFKSTVFWSCFAAFTLVAVSILAVPPDQLPAPVWVDCALNGVSICNETIAHDFRAVIPGRENSRGLVRYRLLQGPGELNEKTGHWVWHPQLSDTLVVYQLRVQAYIRHTDIISEEDCRTSVYYRDFPPRLWFDGWPLTPRRPPVLYVDAPGRRAIAMEITEPDSCQTSSVTVAGISPAPMGEVYVDGADSLVVDLAPGDHGQKFIAYLFVVSGPDSLTFPVVLETRLNVIPQFVACPDTIFVAACGTASADLRAVDPDFPENSVGIRYRFTGAGRPGPGLRYDDQTGEVEVYAPELIAGNEYDITAQAIYGVDTTSAEDNCSFHVVVDGLQPLQFVAGPCDDTVHIPVNTEYETVLKAQPGDSCGGRYVRYFVDTFDPTPSHGYQLIPDDGTFRASLTNADAGQLYTVRIGAANSNDTTFCEFYLQAVGNANPMRVEIQGPADSVEQGTHVNVDVAMTAGDQHLWGFDFLMRHDPSVISFQQATPGDLYGQCAWEYFTYRYAGSVDCGGQPCPSGVLRVVGIGDTNNGAPHPTCYDLDKPYRLFSMDFLVTDDRTWAGQPVPIRFVWYDCGDNAMAINPDPQGDPYAQQLILSNRVYEWSSLGGAELTDPTASFPTFGGATDTCFVSDHERPVRMIDFVNGGIDIERADTIDGVLPYVSLSIEKEHADIPPCRYPLQSPIDVDVRVDELHTSIGGFDLLFGYDAEPLQFVQAVPGPVFDSCGWEYFTYRYGPDGNCDDGCPSGIMRVVGIMETNNGDVHPSCYGLPAPFTLFTLKFLASNDRLWDCQYIPIRFFWMDCGDNAFSIFPAPNGDPYGTLALSRAVYENPGFPITDTTASFPTYFGAPHECFTQVTNRPLRGIDFTNGGVDRVCSDSVGICRGDLNVNGIANEIADNVLFEKYFVYGDSVLTDSTRDYQTATSDVNADGIPFGVADFVYQRRIITGDALPYPHTAPTDTVLVNRFDRVFTVGSEPPLGAVRILVSGLTVPVLLNDNYLMAFSYWQAEDMTSILITPKEFDGSITTGDLFSVTSDPISMTFEAAKYDGSPVHVVIQTPTGVNGQDNPLPTEFGVAQNFPNPFNLETVIPFDLPLAGTVDFEIYNVLGKRVYRHSGQYTAGRHQIVWDGRNAAGQVVASGIYYYRITAGDRSATKKMLLLK